MAQDLKNFRCHWCLTPLRYRKGDASPLAAMLRKEMPILDCPGCLRTFRADPFDAGGEFLVEVIEKVVR